MVGVGQHLVEDHPRLTEPARHGQGLDVPEGAQGEGSLTTGQPVGGGLRVVPEHEAVRDDLLSHAVQGRKEPRVGGGHESDQGHLQQRRIHHVGVVVLDEGLNLLVVAALHDLVVDAIARLTPAQLMGREATFPRDPDGAVKGDPAHHLGVDEVLVAAAGLPNTCVGLIPVVREPVDDGNDALPGVVAEQPVAVTDPEHRVEGLTVDVELQLISRAVADAHRGGPFVALEVRYLLLHQVLGAVDPVHDLQRPGATRGGQQAVAELHPRRQPAQECGCLIGVAQRHQGVEAERTVAHPGESVVPVALPADLLRQRRSRGRDERARRRIRHELQRDSRTGHGLAPATLVVGDRNPVTPEPHGVLELLGDLLRAQATGGGPDRSGLQQDAGDLTVVEGEPGTGDPIVEFLALGVIEHVGGVQRHLGVLGAEQCVVIGERQVVIHPAVVECRGAFHLESHRAA